MVKHDIGLNWALYNNVVLELIFNELFDRQLDVRISPHYYQIQFLTIR